MARASAVPAQFLSGATPEPGPGPLRRNGRGAGSTEDGSTSSEIVSICAPPGRDARGRLATSVNHAGLTSPVAFRIGPISRAISSGAANTLARIAGSLSHAANACPSRRTFGPSAHIHPNPRGRRSAMAEAAGRIEPDAHAATTPRRPCAAGSGVSPASMRRSRIDMARSLAEIQLRASPRSTGDTGGIGSSPGSAAARALHSTRAAAGLVTRRTTAFTRSSRVTRNGAENIYGVLLREAGVFRPPTATCNAKALLMSIKLTDRTLFFDRSSGLGDRFR
jgi:hypothetical protein